MIQDDIYPDDWIPVYQTSPFDRISLLQSADAWYSPSREIVTFGGIWCNRTPWKVDHQPTEDEVYQYATGE